MISNKDLVLKLNEEPEFKAFKFYEGDDTEYGSSHRIVNEAELSRKKFTIEISSKYGNSWFFSDCDGVRMITYKVSYSTYNSVQYRLLDVTGDYNTIKTWLLKVRDLVGNLDSDLEDLREKLVSEIRSLGWSVRRLPKIQYTLNDIDRNFTCLTFDIDTKKTKDRRESVVIQVCKDLETGEIKKFYTTRELTVADYPELISLLPETEFNKLRDVNIFRH